MAYAALVSLTQTIENITQNHDHYSLSLHHKQQILSFNRHIILLLEFFEDFPDKDRIRDAANEAEDIIEFFMWEQTHSFFRSDKWRFLPAMFAKFKSKHHFKHQLQKTRKEIDSIKEEMMAMKHIKDCTVQPGDSAAASTPAPAGHVSDMVGLDEDLLAIKHRLCGEPRKLQIIPIVGMGGIGKTTLARNAYDDPLTMQHFDLRAWVTVSQDYSVRDIISSLLLSLKLPDEEIAQCNELAKVKVYKFLKYRRYLIVMDDMWSREAWDDIRDTFPDDHNGSRLMLTTRISDVASYPDSSSPSHEMHLMDENQSWNLLRAKVFEDEDYPPELESIGKKIAGVCGGLPLAIVVIAGVLSTASRNRASWCEMAKDVTSAVTAEDGKFEEILSLSYTHLPHHLRPCFLYMGGFQEDYEIRVSFLVRLWVAEGFLRPPDESKSLEELAEECLEDLVRRSLVMIGKRKSNGKIKSCRLHDLMRDLCLRKAREEKFLENPGTVDPAISRRDTHRCVCIDLSNLPRLPRDHNSTIRTIMCFQSFFSVRGLGSFRLLRVLIAGEVYVESLPAQFFKLYHLRLLAMVYLKRIPSAIAKLQNLQTLIILERSKELRFSSRLPRAIWRMPRLRHVILCSRLPEPDEGASCVLENLQTLSSLASYMCSERMLKMIPNVKKLKIQCYHLGAYLENLVNLHQLQSLELHAAPEYRVWRNEDNLCFPTKLRKLTLSGLHLPWSKMRIVGSLPDLQVLKLRNAACDGKTWETVEGEFPELEFLLIEESDLEEFITESSHFPKLKSLLLHHCWQLCEIPNDIGEIPTLQFIEVKGHHKKTLVESVRGIQEEQQSYGNALRVRCSSFRKQYWWAQRICF